MKNIFIILTSIFIFGSLSCERSEDAINSNAISNTKWKLTKIINSNAGEISEFPSEIKDFEIIFKEDGKIELPNYCNYSFGKYQVTDDNSIIIDDVGPGTEKYCLPDLAMEWENLFITSLLDAQTYSISDNKLTITSPDKKLIFDFISAYDNDENNMVLLKVDYMNFDFEGGAEIQLKSDFAENDSLPILTDYDPPGDFGNITLFYSFETDTIFDGSIIWMGTGQITFPKHFDPASEFARINNNLQVPDSSKFQRITYSDQNQVHYPDPYHQKNRYDSVWYAIDDLKITETYLESKKNIGIFLYTPSVGAGDPQEWDWIVFMNKK